MKLAMSDFSEVEVLAIFLQMSHHSYTYTRNKNKNQTKPFLFAYKPPCFGGHWGEKS